MASRVTEATSQSVDRVLGGKGVQATAFVFGAAAATLAAAASTDPAQRFEAAPEVDWSTER
jgi:hypothetical protein